LTSDNPSIPKRIRTSCPKNSYVETNEPAKLSITQQEQSQSSLNNYRETTSSSNSHQSQEESNKKGVNRNQIAQSESDLKIGALVLQNKELREAVKRQTAAAAQIPATEIQFTIPKENIHR
jgi:hypothetical protein